MAIYLIDRMGRRPLLLIGTAGIAVSLLICAYGFNQATYQLNEKDINQFEFLNSEKLISVAIKSTQMMSILKMRLNHFRY